MLVKGSPGCILNLHHGEPPTFPIQERENHLTLWSEVALSQRYQPVASAGSEVARTPLKFCPWPGHPLLAQITIDSLATLDMESMTEFYG